MEPTVNPFLEAQAKKSMLNNSNSTATPKMGGTWNPFKKSTTPTLSVTASGGRSGIVFDDMAKKDVIKSSIGKSKSTFGDRKKFDAKQSPSPISTSRMVSLPKKKDKENKTDNLKKEDENKPLKGFLLWFEENSQKVSEKENILNQDTLRDHCLKLWQDMSKSDKESYKTPRLPKRKREEDNNDNSTVSKLARFAASK